VRECKCSDCGILLENDLVVWSDNSTSFTSRIKRINKSIRKKENN